MSNHNIVTLRHFSRRGTLPALFNLFKFTKGVEIGTDKGEYAEVLCQKIPGLQLTCVDPWLPYTEGTEVHDQADIDKIYAKAQQRLLPYNVRFLKMTSMEAATKFEDNSLDFVFIDGNHDYQHAREDIEAWTPKVRMGGIVCGHDYTASTQPDYGVIEAVNEYTQSHEISPLFILDSSGNFTQCWMFFKGHND